MGQACACGRCLAGTDVGVKSLKKSSSSADADSREIVELKGLRPLQRLLLFDHDRKDQELYPLGSVGHVRAAQRNRRIAVHTVGVVAIGLFC